MPVATILITGARRGIGFDVVNRLAQRGHRIHATVHKESEVEPLRAALQAHGDRVTVAKLDITDAADRVRAATWDVDVLINNAAIGDSGPLLEIDVNRIRRVFETNVHATLELTQGVVRRMIARRVPGARVILVGSIAGLIPTPYLAPYAMTKFALESLAFALRAELKPLGVFVTMINPGAYNTGFNAENIERKAEWMGPDSLYRDLGKSIRRAEGEVLNFEVGNTGSIARKIVQAVEATRPRKRYAAPWWQWMAVPFARWLG